MYCGPVEMDGTQPIGYWLKHLDRLLEQCFDHALAGAGLARRHWQVLHALRSGDGLDVLAPFWADPAGPSAETVLADLAGRGWLTGPPYALTPAGEAGHDAVQTRVRALRRAVVDGMTEADYVAVVSGLQRMANNVEAALR